MIKKTSQGYEVLSESGKHLSRRNLSKAAAKKRLKQVEYFKHQDAIKKSLGGPRG